MPDDLENLETWQQRQCNAGLHVRVETLTRDGVTSNCVYCWAPLDPFTAAYDARERLKRIVAA